MIATLPVDCGCKLDEQGRHERGCPLDTPDPRGPLLMQLTLSEEPGHDNDCESEFYVPPGTWTPCRCLDRYNETMKAEHDAAIDKAERDAADDMELPGMWERSDFE